MTTKYLLAEIWHTRSPTARAWLLPVSYTHLDVYKRQLQAQIDEQEELKQALEEKAVYVQSKEYIEELAREKLGLVKENEIIFKKDEK